MGVAIGSGRYDVDADALAADIHGKRLGDPAIAGRVTFPRWRKRRYLVRGRASTEGYSARPSPHRDEHRFRRTRIRVSSKLIRANRRRRGTALS
jgi:hypothetical protein